MKRLQFLFVFFVFLLTGAVLLSLRFSYIGSDAPYYLSVARDISEGKIPYKDIYLSYSPIVMYLHAVLLKMLPHFQYWSVLLLQYVVIICSGAILFLLVMGYRNLERKKASILAIFYVLSVLSSDGNDVVLEAYSNLCVFGALLCLFKKKILWVGILLGLSFMCKQYGLLNFIPFIMFFILERKEPLRKIGYMSAGAVIPLVIFLFYFSGYEDISVVSLFQQLNGAKYTGYSLLYTKNIESYLIGAKVFILLSIPAFIMGRKMKVDVYFQFLLIGIIVNLIPLVLQGYQHYYINTFPFLFLYFADLWKRSGRRLLIYHSASVLLISGLFYMRVFRYSDRSKKQNEVAEVISTILPPGRKVFLNGEVRYLYLLNNYKNPAAEEVGYSYPFRPDEKFLNKTTVLSSNLLIERPDDKIKIGFDEFYLYENE